jgi:hypothetical protein
MAVELDVQFILAKCDYFAEVQVWPLQQKLSPARWLDNFEAADRNLAAHLLNGFLYFSEAMVDQMFGAAIQSLSSAVLETDSPFFLAQSAWRAFLDSAIITYVTGERPNPTDSGQLFSRKARQLVGIAESSILSPDHTVLRLMTDVDRTVIFVDDFVGSGNQFVKTWLRPIRTPGGADISFAKLSTVARHRFFYCPLHCTELGLNRIQKECPSVKVVPAHLVPSRYSALAPDSVIWPQHLLSQGADFIQRYSAVAGIPDSPGAVDDWRGFAGLGLTMAFAHSVPDATLPLFYWEKNGWAPLIRRT